MSTLPEDNSRLSACLKSKLSWAGIVWREVPGGVEFSRAPGNIAISDNVRYTDEALFDILRTHLGVNWTERTEKKTVDHATTNKYAPRNRTVSLADIVRGMIARKIIAVGFKIMPRRWRVGMALEVRRRAFKEAGTWDAYNVIGF